MAPCTSGAVKRRTVIIIAVLLVAAIAVGVIANAAKASDAGKPTEIAFSETTVLTHTDVLSTISATGTVESDNTEYVYSTLSYKVTDVIAEVGDKVNEGDILATLDASSIRDQIATSEATLALSKQSGSAQIKATEDSYTSAKDTLAAGLNSAILSAQSQVDATRTAYENAVDSYERYKAALDGGENTSLLSQESALSAAKSAVTNAENALSDAKDAKARAEDSLANGLDDMARGLQRLNERMTDAKDALDDAKDAKNDAEEAYEQAVEAFDDADIALYDAQEEIETLNAQYEAALSGGDAAAAEAIKTALGAASEKLTKASSRYSSAASAMASAQAGVASAEAAVTNCENAVESLEDTLEDTGISNERTEKTLRDALANAEEAVRRCENALGTANKNLETTLTQSSAVQTTVDNALSDYEKAVSTALANYESAKSALSAAEKAVADQLTSAENNLNSVIVSSDTSVTELSIAQLYDQLAKTEIKAPVSGTVTAVYATVGGSGAGLLFVIEDTENLIVETSVKSYDIGTVVEGLPVLISSDATGEREFNGEITKIAPTSTKDQNGNTHATSDPLFAAEVAIGDKDTGLRIGMSAQLDFVIEKREDVFTVPYDAVFTGEDGGRYILILTDNGDETHTVSRLAVTEGLEGNVDTEIDGDGLAEGVRVINAPDRYLELVGSAVTLTEKKAAAFNPFEHMMEQMG